MRIDSTSISVPLVVAGVALCMLTASRPASAEWPQSGRAISTAAGDQVVSAIAADRNGAAIITWVDFRDPTANVFVGRVLASGELDAAWPVNGRALRTDPLALTGEPADPARPVIVPDGAGGAIVAWLDGRSGQTETDIFAQHVLPSGAVDPAWPANGRPVCVIRGLQVAAEIVPDGAGGAIVTWMDGRDLGTASSVDVYAQHILASGLVDPSWPANGLAVSTADGPQEFPAIVEDGAGGAVITWYDLRNGTNFDIYAQHVLNSGTVDPAWPVNGRALCTDPSDQFNPTITSDGEQGAIVAWDDNRNASFHPFAQHVLASGDVDPSWPVNGLAISNGVLDEDFPKLAPDGAGGAIVTWQARGPFISHRAQHLLGKGITDPEWPVDGRALSIHDTDQISASIVPDGAGGAVVVWQENLDDIVAQHVLASGALDPLYPATGRVIVQLPSQQSAPALVATGAGGAIATWSDTRNGVGIDVFAMQVLAAGETVDVPAPALGGITFAPPSPNPASESSALRFILPRQMPIRLAIYDAAGRRVRELASGDQPAGEHVVAWDLRDEGGRAIRAGLYFVRLDVEGFVLARRLVTLR
jgi:hypothetical protein